MSSHHCVNSDRNWGPPSDLMLIGFPCSRNQSFRIEVTALVSSFVRGHTNGQLEYLSTKIRY